MIVDASALLEFLLQTPTGLESSSSRVMPRPGRVGTYQAAFTVPNLNKEETRVPISTVVLGSQRLTVADAIYNVKQKTDAERANPLVYDGRKLIRSVRRVFSTQRDRYVFLEAYQHDAPLEHPLVAFVTFYRDEAKVLETAPLPVTEGWNPKSKAVPLRLSIPLASVPTGRYDCQITVLDPGNQKVAFWRAPIALIP